MSRPVIVVVGAGVIGLATALRLAQAGAEVVLHDPGESDDSASGVAAGMLGPGLESALDPTSHGHFALLSHARDLWPSLLETAVEGHGMLDRSGALFAAEAVDEIAGRLSGLGARAERLGPLQARTLVPGLAAASGEFLFLPDEWRIAPRAALGALSAAFARTGGRRERTRVIADGGRLVLEDGGALMADRVVIAAGAEAAALAGAAPELAALTPIKGQILHFDGGPSAGPVVRSRGVYVSPQPGGAVVGATMEPGRADRRTDPAALERLSRSEVRRTSLGEGRVANGVAISGDLRSNFGAPA